MGDRGRGDYESWREANPYTYVRSLEMIERVGSLQMV